MARTTEVIMNNTAKTDVNLPSNSSIPFFFPKKVSAPPAIEPDKPSLFPDCINTVIINPKLKMTCTIRITVINI